MKYGYDLRNPIERQMYIDKHKKDLERQFDDTKTIQENYNELIEEKHKEFEYFRMREKQKKAAAAEAERLIQQEIEKQLPKVIEKALNDLLKGFK